MPQRALVRLLMQLAQERGITVHTLSHGWILLLQKNGQVRRVFGYDFDLNDAVAQMLAKDKSAAALLLQFHNVPCIEHHLFLRSDIEAYTPEKGNWTALIALAETYGFQLVCKPNSGTSGQDVYRVRNPRELEWAVQRLFQHHKAIAVAPYYTIPHEYRLILLDGQVLLAYEKRRPEVLGDGHTPLGELAVRALRNHPLALRVLAEAQEIYGPAWYRPVPRGERRVLIWRHNLAAGAEPRLPLRAELLARLEPLARRATQVLGLRVAAVDIVELDDGELRVLEVNSGIMMEHFVARYPQGETLARRVYAALLDQAFAPSLDIPPTPFPHSRHLPGLSS